MRDRVDEAVVLLVATNLTHQENCVEDEASGDSPKKNDAQKNFNASAPVENDPAAADSDSNRRQANAKCQEKIDCLLPADDAHREIVAGQ